MRNSAVSFGTFLVLVAVSVLPSVDAPGYAQTGRTLFGAFERCGTSDPTASQIRECRTAIARIETEPGVTPSGGEIGVVVHVLSCEGEGFVPDHWIERQIAELNRAYRGSGFSFRIERVEHIEDCDGFRMSPGSAAEASVKNTYAVDPSHTLNLYTCEPARSLLGWSYLPVGMPEDDLRHGVIVHWRTLPGGGLDPFALGRTAVHEVGHYLGLFHTFQNGCVAPGDDIDDTPYEALPAFGCPEGRNTCAQAGVDPVHNYMDYSDDACVEEFTPGQIERMQQVTAIYRPSLLGHLIAARDGRAPAPSTAARADDLSDIARRAAPDAHHGPAIEELGLPWFDAVTPNPVGRECTMRFTMAQRGWVVLQVVDKHGKRADTVLSGYLGSGQHAIAWRPPAMKPGLYFAELRVSGQPPRRRMIWVER